MLCFIGEDDSPSCSHQESNNTFQPSSSQLAQEQERLTKPKKIKRRHKRIAKNKQTENHGQLKNANSQLFVASASENKNGQKTNQEENKADGSKGNFDDHDFQELSSFDCSYHYNQMVPHGCGNVASKLDARHIALCGGRLSGKMLSLAAARAAEHTHGLCSSTQASAYSQQMMETVASGNSRSCDLANTQVLVLVVIAGFLI